MSRITTWRQHWRGLMLDDDFAKAWQAEFGEVMQWRDRTVHTSEELAYRRVCRKRGIREIAKNDDAKWCCFCHGARMIPDGHGGMLPGGKKVKVPWRAWAHDVCYRAWLRERETGAADKRWRGVKGVGQHGGRRPTPWEVLGEAPPTVSSTVRDPEPESESRKAWRASLSKRARTRPRDAHGHLLGKGAGKPKR